MAARRSLSQRDREEWAAFARQIRPMPGRPTPPSAAPEPTPEPAPAVPPAPPLLRSAPAAARQLSALAIGEPVRGLDKATWRRLHSGRLAPARTLDLHGYTAQRAFHALHHLLMQAHAEQLRCIEVITGRGAGETGGVIRRELPLWLNLPTLRPFVLAAAHPHPANPGATRILLRRSRK